MSKPWGTPGLGRLLGICGLCLGLFGQNDSAWPATVQQSPGEIELIPQAEMQYEQAVDFYREGRHSEALRLFSEALPSLAATKKEEALFDIGECYRFLSRPADALSVYRMLTQSYPKSLFAPAAWFWEGKLLMEREHYGEAIPLLQLALDHGAGETLEAARYLLALCDFHVGNEAAGSEQLRKVASGASPYRWEAARLLAVYLEKKRDWAGALSYWQTIATQAKAPSIKWQATARAGWAAMRAGEAKKAEEFFGRCLGPDVPSQWQTLASEGQFAEALSQKHFEEALTFLQSRPERFSLERRVALLVQLGNACLQAGEKGIAFQVFESCLSLNPPAPAFAEAAYGRLVALIGLNQKGVLDEATAFLDRFGSSSPYAARVRFIQAQALSARGRFADALPLWQEIVSQNPAGVPRSAALLGLGRAYFESGRWKEAGETLERLGKGSADAAELLTARMTEGAAWDKAGDAAKALEAWKEALELAPRGSPQREASLVQTALLARQLEKPTQMEQSFRSLVDEYPKAKLRPLGCLLLGQAELKEKKYAEAQKHLLEAREGEPTQFFGPATTMLVWVAYGEKDLEKMEHFLGELEEKAPESAAQLPAALYYWAGLSWAKENRLILAKNALRKVCSRSDAGTYLASAYWQLAEIERKLHEWPGAVQCYQEFRKLDPNGADNSPVLLGFAEAETGAGEYGSAQKHLEQVLLQEPEGRRNAEARMLLGNLYWAQKNYAEAAKTYSTLSLIYQDNEITPRAMEKAASSFARSGDDAQAANWRKLLREKYPDFKPDA
ncbi:tetratricopeptide repeat protein [Verrucomicrobium sp. 3C]|uniref:tetratricopeptide repeat protein n=1 Tax=Verrucomicrobium sp. 3C TaxID=1134055 RepID=UPI00036F0D0C|nr:tetratricopeptide repeat protein [Verrucomicrobium sp. 3C]